MKPGIGTKQRWLTFNGIGLIGVVIQLGVLTILQRIAELPIGIATALAVEAAVLHNFVWHQQVTWRDRPSGAFPAVLERLVRFHALNGMVSLCGNVVITMALSAAGLHAIAANGIAIAVCSTVNYVAGDRLVFATRSAALLLCTTFLWSSSAQRLHAADEDSMLLVSGPSAAAVAAWDKYVAGVDARHARPSADNFFALDLRRVKQWRDAARNGQVPMVEVDPPGAPDSKIHHWAGAIYVPNTTVDAVVKRLQESAGREQAFYQEVKASKLLERSGDRVRVFLRLERGAAGVSATLNTEHTVDYKRFDATHAGSRSVATKIAELQNVGTPDERERTPGNDRGFLWRLNAYWRFEQAGDGVLIECESVSLSRSVPLLIRPIASPIVNRIARESLQRTLVSLRTFLTRT
jgi:putative flippase GtrA